MVTVSPGITTDGDTVHCATSHEDVQENANMMRKIFKLAPPKRSNFIFTTEQRKKQLCTVQLLLCVLTRFAHWAVRVSFRIVHPVGRHRFAW